MAQQTSQPPILSKEGQEQKVIHDYLFDKFLEGRKTVYKGSGRELTKPELYAQFTGRLGLEPADVINEYGMTELTSQFYARGLGAPHHAPHWLRATVVDPSTGTVVADGETGILHIHDLANLGSVAKLATRDLAVRRGDAFELLGRDPGALPRGCSRQADEFLSNAPRP